MKAPTLDIMLHSKSTDNGKKLVLITYRNQTNGEFHIETDLTIVECDNQQVRVGYPVDLLWETADETRTGSERNKRAGKRDIGPKQQLSAVLAFVDKRSKIHFDTNKGEVYKGGDGRYRVYFRLFCVFYSEAGTGWGRYEVEFNATFVYDRGHLYTGREEWMPKQLYPENDNWLSDYLTRIAWWGSEGINPDALVPDAPVKLSWLKRIFRGK